MYYVNARFFAGTARVGAAVAYIAHREERLPGGRTRELYGIGGPYRALGGDEPAIVGKLREDARHLKQPRYYRIKLTVDDRAAERLARLGAPWSELALRDAVDKSFRGALRKAQGVYVLHENEQGKRPFGNPHVHVLLGPRLSDGRPYFISKKQLQAFKERWHAEFNRALASLERRITATPGHAQPLRGYGRGRALLREAARDQGLSLRPGLLAAARQAAEGHELRAAGTVARTLPGTPGRVARAQREVMEAASAPERSAIRHGFRLATRLLPEPIRQAVSITRTLGLFLPRE